MSWHGQNNNSAAYPPYFHQREQKRCPTAGAKTAGLPRIQTKPNRNRFPAKSQALKSISQNERIDVMIDPVHAHQFTEKTNIAK